MNTVICPDCKIAIFGPAVVNHGEVLHIRCDDKRKAPGTFGLAPLFEDPSGALSLAELAEGDSLARNSRHNRAAIRAVVDALPQCEWDDCTTVATREHWSIFAFGRKLACEGHSPRHSFATDLSYAATVLTLLERMKSWSTP